MVDVPFVPAGLWLVWAVLLGGGFLLGKPHAQGARRIPLVARMAMSMVLVLAALAWLLYGTSGTPLAAYSALICLGMAFGFLGDLFMARLLPVAEEKIFGIGAFAAGHLFYLAAFLRIATLLDLADWTLFGISIGAYALLALAAWRGLVRNPRQPGALNYGTLGYALLISAVSAVALALAWQDPRFWPLFAGTLLFVVSDLILANQFMRGTHWRLISDVVWSTYTTGQMLIVYSTAFLLPLATGF